MTFTPQVWEHFKNPHGRGSLLNYTSEGWAGSRQSGLYMRIQLRIHNNIIEEAAFETVGCLSAIASGSALVEWASGKTLDQLIDLQPSQIDLALGGLRPDKKDCAEMAVHAFKRAVENAQNKEASQ